MNPTTTKWIKASPSYRSCEYTTRLQEFVGTTRRVTRNEQSQQHGMQPSDFICSPFWAFSKTFTAARSFDGIFCSSNSSSTATAMVGLSIFCTCSSSPLWFRMRKFGPLPHWERQDVVSTRTELPNRSVRTSGSDVWCRHLVQQSLF